MSLSQKKQKRLILYFSDCFTRRVKPVLSNKIMADLDMSWETLDEISGPLEGKGVYRFTDEQGQTCFYLDPEIVERARKIRNAKD